MGEALIINTYPNKLNFHSTYSTDLLILISYSPLGVHSGSTRGPLGVKPGWILRGFRVVNNDKVRDRRSG
jgi:hypothetical protein